MRYRSSSPAVVYENETSVTVTSTPVARADVECGETSPISTSCQVGMLLPSNRARKMNATNFCMTLIASHAFNIYEAIGKK